MNWLGGGDAVCDCCHDEIHDELYDVKTMYGCWGTLCKCCNARIGLGKLGVGYGQKYVWDGKNFVKVEG